MHELAVTQSVLAIALEAAQQAGGPRIVGIDLVIGELSSIVDDSVQFHFDILSQGTLAEDARLHFRRIPTSVFCWDCSERWDAHAPLLPECPLCGSARLQVEGGQEFYVDCIEVEDQAA